MTPEDEMAEALKNGMIRVFSDGSVRCVAGVIPPPPKPRVIDPDDCKFVFPIPEEGIKNDDAVYTLGVIERAELVVTEYAENGNDCAGDLFVDLSSDEGYDDLPDDEVDGGGCFIPGKRAKLIDLLECELQSYLGKDYPVEDEFSAEEGDDNKVTRLLIRLVRAYREWQRTDATYTPDQLREI